MYVSFPSKDARSDRATQQACRPVLHCGDPTQTCAGSQQFLDGIDQVRRCPTRYPTLPATIAATSALKPNQTTRLELSPAEDTTGGAIESFAPAATGVAPLTPIWA